MSQASEGLERYETDASGLRKSLPTNGRDLAKDIGCSWREVARNCHCDPDAATRDPDRGDGDE